jgi:hypothetical protein
MEISIVTQDDLHALKADLINYLDQLKTDLIQQQPNNQPEEVFLKSHQVQRMLAISAGTLQTLRNNGSIPYSKVGGVIFYKKRDILRVIEENQRNC